MNLLTRIQNLCNEHGINVTQLRIRAGIGNGVIGKWGSSTPQVSTLLKIAIYFDVSFDYLLGLSDVRTIATKEDNQLAEMSKLEDLVAYLLAQLEDQELTFNNKPIDAEQAKIARKLFESNLEVLSLMSE